jgi:hypothetical protein
VGEYLVVDPGLVGERETRIRWPDLGNTTAGEHEGPAASGRETKGLQGPVWPA